MEAEVGRCLEWVLSADEAWSQGAWGLDCGGQSVWFSGGRLGFLLPVNFHSSL